jgi:hypothetical protein
MRRPSLPTSPDMHVAATAVNSVAVISLSSTRNTLLTAHRDGYAKGRAQELCRDIIGPCIHLININTDYLC